MSRDRAGLARRWIAWLCRALPSELREGYGVEIESSFDARHRAIRHSRGRVAAAVFMVRSSLDLVTTGLRERRTGGRGRTRFVSGMEFRRALRGLRRSPGFTAAAVLVLGLGIGVNAAMFTALKSLLLTAPQYPSADRLVLVDLQERSGTSNAAQAYPWSYPKFEQFRAQESNPFDALAGFAPWSVTLATKSQTLKASLEFVSAEYLTILGARPERGRLFGRTEDVGASPTAVAVISHRFWVREFGGDPGAVGSTVEIESKPVEIIGVMASGFAALTGEAELWMPMTAAALLFGRPMVEQPQAHWFRVAGRLRAETPLEKARAQAEAELARTANAFASPVPGATMSVAVTALRDARIHPSARTAVLILSGAALLVLLITCANLAGLMLARGLERGQELAVQVALGASRSRVRFGLLVESLTLAVAGGLAGLVVAQLGVVALRSLWPSRFAMSGAGGGGGFAALRAFDPGTLSLDPAVLAFAGGLTLLTAALFGLVPAFQLSSTRGSGLGSGARLVNAERSGSYGAALIAGEVALALVLLVGAGLMMGSLVRLVRVDPGFDSRQLLTFSYGIPRSSAHSRNAAAFHEVLLEQLRADRRVVGASTGCVAPQAGHCQLTNIAAVEGRPPFDESNWPQVGMHRISDDYFETLRVPLVSGRAFNRAETPSSLPVAMLNRTAVRVLFGDGDPLDRTISVPGKFGPSQEYKVVGVVGDMLHTGPADGVMAEVYLSLRQSAPRDVNVVVRTAGSPLSLVPAIRERMRTLEPGIALADVRTVEAIAQAATADTRVMFWLLGLFAIAAVLLSAIGIWSVVAYAVNRRTREIGLRMALGAPSAAVVSLVLRRGARAALLGLVLGVPVAIAASRLMQTLIFGLQPTDARVHVAAAAVLCSVALLASWIPARRATRVDPMRAMRAE